MWTVIKVHRYAYFVIALVLFGIGAGLEAAQPLQKVIETVVPQVPTPQELMNPLYLLAVVFAALIGASNWLMGRFLKSLEDSARNLKIELEKTKVDFERDFDDLKDSIKEVRDNFEKLRDKQVTACLLYSELKAVHDTRLGTGACVPKKKGI